MNSNFKLTDISTDTDTSNGCIRLSIDHVVIVPTGLTFYTSSHSPDSALDALLETLQPTVDTSVTTTATDPIVATVAPSLAAPETPDAIAAWLTNPTAS